MSGSRRPTRGSFHETVIASTFGPDLSQEDALLVMALLHCYRFVFKEGTLSDAPALSGFDALTQRDAAAVVARLWRGSHEHPDRASGGYWYWQWNGDWGSYGHLDRLTTGERDRLRELKERIESHPLVTRLQPEDWDLIEDDPASAPDAAD